MDRPILVCLFERNGSPDDEPFRQPFEKIAGIQILGEFSTWESLEECAKRYEADIIAVSLDDDPDLALRIVERIGRSIPGCGVIGISRAADPQSIIRAMRAGCAQFVCRPVDVDDLKSAIDRIRSSRPLVPEESKRICVIGASGGAGATAVSCNLAIELARLTSRRCALIDMNLEFGDICCAFDCTPKFTISDVCGGSEELDRTMLSSALHELPCKVSILARPNRIEDAEAVTSEGVERLFKVLGDMFPVVVVDLPRVACYLSTAALHRTHNVLIIAQLSVPSIRNATRVYDSVLRMGADESRVEIVINRFSANFERITTDDVEKHFSRPVFATIPNDYEHVAASLDLGHPIGADAPNSPSRKAIQDMARKILGDQVAKRVDSKDGKGFLKRLLNRK